MKFSDVMAYYDYKIINICRALNVHRMTVNYWKKNNRVPFNMQCVIEVVSQGKLKATKEENE